MARSQSRLEAKIIAAVLGRLPTPPVDLLAIADGLNVHDIRYIHGTSIEGATHFRVDGPVIYLGRLEKNEDNKGAGTQREIRTLNQITRLLVCQDSSWQISDMWLTLAHELAHVMLRRPEVLQIMVRRGGPPLSKEGEERLADKIAETLLIPDDWVEAIQVSHPTLEKLENVAALGGVSVSMLVVRLASAGKDIGLMQWQRGKHSWYVTDRPGAPPYLHRNIKLSEAGIIALDNADCWEDEIVADGCMGQHRITISGTGRREGKYVTQLFRPSLDVWMTEQPSPHSSDPQAATPSLLAEIAPRPTERRRATAPGQSVLTGHQKDRETRRHRQPRAPRQGSADQCHAPTTTDDSANGSWLRSAG
jgi:hypothetical protein